MNSPIHYTACPSCSFNGIRRITHAIDYTVSAERFEIWECPNCSLRFTQDVPDASSIGHYYKSANYISHTNTSTGIVNRLYHVARSVTIKSKVSIVERYTSRNSGNLLDVGAGTGVFATAMQQAGWKVTAVEPDKTARSIALKQYDLVVNDISHFFELPASSFHAITLWHVLEHIHQLHEYLNQLKQILARDGVIFIAVPNYTSYDANLYEEYWAAYDVPRHLYHFSPQSMKILLEKHAMTIVKTLPMWLDSLYVSLLSEKNKNGKSALLKGFANGIFSNAHALKNIQRCSSLIYIVKSRL